MRPTFLNGKLASKRGFKRVELKEASTPNNHQLTFPLSIEMSRSPTPEVTRSLFSTGFVYKNTISPKIANVRIDQNLKIKPAVPTSQTLQKLDPIKDKHKVERVDTSASIERSVDVLNKSGQVGSIGWGVSNLSINQIQRRKVLAYQPHKSAYDHG